MTFSIVGRSKDGKQLGVAVASKFLAVGAYVPAASAGAGALATQAYGNVAFKTDGIDMLRQGMLPQKVIDTLLGNDPQRDERQIGLVGADGKAVTYTGKRCQSWAGGRAAEHLDGSYAVQGNMLAGSQVVDAMVESWLASGEEPSLAIRLTNALQSGQDAGGDPRGKQAAAILVVEEHGGYGGIGDVVIDLRSDDSPDPIHELRRMIDLHELYFGKTPVAKLLLIDSALEAELKAALQRVHYDSGDISRDLYDWMGRENLEERWHDNKIDPIVLEQLRIAAGS